MTPSVIISALVLAAEPASILYIATGAVGFVYAGLRRSNKSVGTRAATLPQHSSVPMLFCRRTSRTMLKSLHLL